VTIQKRVSEK